MHISIQVEEDGIDIAQQYLLDLHAKLNDIAPFLGAIGQGIADSTQERIADDKRSPSGVAWAELLPSTIEKKGSDDILIDTNHLKESIAWQVQGDVLLVGTDMAYGKYLQFGTQHMVARPFLGLSDSDVTLIKNRLNEWLQ